MGFGFTGQRAKDLQKLVGNEYIFDYTAESKYKTIKEIYEDYKKDFKSRTVDVADYNEWKGIVDDFEKLDIVIDIPVKDLPKELHLQDTVTIMKGTVFSSKKGKIEIYNHSVISNSQIHEEAYIDSNVLITNSNIGERVGIASGSNIIDGTTIESGGFIDQKCYIKKSKLGRKSSVLNNVSILDMKIPAFCTIKQNTPLFLTGYFNSFQGLQKDYTADQFMEHYK